MNYQKILLALFVLTLPVMACSTSLLGQPIALVTLTPGVQPTFRLPPGSDRPLVSPAPAASRQGKVCFDKAIADGNLRVRECPGLDCKEAAVLTEGDLITSTGERKDVDGVTWLRITSPIAGWVSSQYVCEK